MKRGKVKGKLEAKIKYSVKNLEIQEVGLTGKHLSCRRLLGDLSCFSYQNINPWIMVGNTWQALRTTVTPAPTARKCSPLGKESNINIGPPLDDHTVQ
jgi:hypothetical protein